MITERDRLLSLIEFAQQAARLRGRPVAAVAEHRNFALHEHRIRGLPGIHVNVGGVENDDEIWLAVERLHETRPPIISPVLRPWVEVAQSPTDEPRLREVADAASLVSVGLQGSSTSSPDQARPTHDPAAAVSLSDFEMAGQVRAQFATYLNTSWRPWAAEEKLRRDTIHLYSQLFTLKQQLEDGIVEAQLELVWGVGVGIWRSSGTTVTYPLIGRSVEISLNPVTAEVEIRPRDVDPRLEIDWYAAVDNLGVAGLEKAAKEFFDVAERTFSPFDRGTFEPLLRSAVTHLDANGVYWPTQVPAEDRTLPETDENLKVTDTWVLFARPRTNSLFLQDLEKLRKQAEEAEAYPPAVAAVVTQPASENTVVELPSFRGVSASGPVEESTSGKKARDLYFPKPFNDEQVRIVQLLDVSDGVVVQGPPGTGKTHTIANVICHYLAQGKRVLVTSMKDPALAVLQEQLPAEIRPLAISLLTSEQDGMKQFEHAIQKIAFEVQSLDRAATTRVISHLEESIDALHGKLGSTDQRIGEWARRNLARITLDTEELDSQDAAREVAESSEEVERIPDRLGMTSEFAPQFSDADIVQLREARRVLGEDIDYLDASLPQLVEFPDSKALLAVHRDLAQFEKLKQDVDRGHVPALADSSEETLGLVYQLLDGIINLQRLRDDILQANRYWTTAIHERLVKGQGEDLLRVLEALGTELYEASQRRKAFLVRPVTTHPGIEADPEVVEAVANLAQGRAPFGLRGLFGKSEQKRHLDNVRVLGDAPLDAETWRHVAEHLELLKRFRELALRWNALARELHLETVPDDRPEGGLAASEGYAVYMKVKAVVSAERELSAAAPRVFPNWPHSREVATSAERLSELDGAIRHHITKNRLADVWAIKERCQRVLEGRTGRVIDDFRLFFREVLGNPAVADGELQTKWSDLLTELSRVLGLGGHLAIVRDVCEKVEASGAPRFAALLKKPVEGTVDRLLPDSWRKAWRLRRLTTYLESIDAHEELKRLARHRLEVEGDLSRAYRDVVVKRTGLKLAENASPSIRAALQAYLNAIQKIGKGTGKRAVRFRRDARIAASLANPAVPCWIMAHYRVSESLPAELGCFDLVVIDEASQSDLTALPSLLRAQKALIVGDDKQVSPDAVGLEEERVRSLMNRFLGNQVETYRAQMSPQHSIYDLFKVVFARSAVMLREHFRCVGPIIEYSKREFYNHELRPLRIPMASERLDPPLIDIVVKDGYRNGDVNLPEARVIVDEIKAIAADPKMDDRSIGVVSLLADKQALAIWERLTRELGPEGMERHHIACGDARTFQGKERDIMFLSMVSAPNQVGAPLTREAFAQRFNVAASRARDRMYLVRSVGPEGLSEADQLRRRLIAHFVAPFAQDEGRVEDLRKLCESPFEREVYDELVQRGYWVTPQVKVGQFRIDLVVEGHNDARLAIECDGDKYHGADKWTDDMQRQRILERAGWVFWRCFASAFIRRRKEILIDLLNALAARGIEPIGAAGAPRSVHTEHRAVLSAATPPDERGSSSVETPESNPLATLPVTPFSTDPEERPGPSVGSGLGESVAARGLFERARASASSDRSRRVVLPFGEYSEYSGPAGSDPRGVRSEVVYEGLLRIIGVEGPLLAKRAYDIYLRGCGVLRMGHELKSSMNKALAHAIRLGRVVSEDEAATGGQLFSVVRLKGSPPIRLRRRGPRSFDEIPPSELQVVARYLAERGGLPFGSEEHLHAVLEAFDLVRLTRQVGKTLQQILGRKSWYVDEFLRDLP